MTQAKEKILVVVDGYSSGSQLPTLMAESGWKCLHVSSSANPPEYYLRTYHKNEYIAHFEYQGDIQPLADAVEAWRPAAVLPGTESGVIVADLLAAALQLPGNAPSTSLARRDKYTMHERLKAASLRSMDHFLAVERSALSAWAERGSWPVVIKPQASAGTDSVTFCADQRELLESFDKLFGTVNQLGERNDAVLAQRLLVGPEYFINGVSGHGKHLITEIWRADKLPAPDGGWIYDRAVLFDPTSPEMQEIVEYVHGVLDALGIRYGANHTELIVTADGPTLIECASRLSGGLNRPAANYAVGSSQLDLVGKLVREGESAIDDILQTWQPHRYPLWQVQFISNQEGVVARSSYDELLKTFKSKAWLQRAPKEGDTVVKTIDLFSSPGIVFMSHADSNVLHEDYKTVREWERTSRLFTVQ
ncbi:MULTISPECIES: ATP-grasp domain-containing protein [unclassified Pseudomonas]|uniref:ATP-grasp domain-containing protein n=1 Tax=unclassified Pseudomonas TaxID=196821 RepID=UPI00083807A1|nr:MULTISPECIES: ATP-grasp domain-containing protein [unclassified Pseudomonas]QIH08104.1 ATP-grasp domain-containing protein [Pseudomonas sp. BIOMIG1BAC]